MCWAGGLHPQSPEAERDRGRALCEDCDVAAIYRKARDIVDEASVSYVDEEAVIGENSEPMIGPQ